MSLIQSMVGEWGDARNATSDLSSRFLVPTSFSNGQVQLHGSDWHGSWHYLELADIHATQSINSSRWLINAVGPKKTQSETGRLLSRREQIWQKSERKLQRKSILDEVRTFSPYEFEKLIADIFSSRGMAAHAVGGTADDGIDVKIWDRNGNFWAIAQCKRYAADNKIGASQIRDFAGAYMLSKAKKGFFFCTSSYTRHAKRTARGYPWLTIYDGQSFVRYIEELKYRIDHQNTWTASIKTIGPSRKAPRVRFAHHTLTRPTLNKTKGEGPALVTKFKTLP